MERVFLGSANNLALLRCLDLLNFAFCWLNLGSSLPCLLCLLTVYKLEF